jgi:hypothetical protein
MDKDLKKLQEHVSNAREALNHGQNPMAVLASVVDALELITTKAAGSAKPAKAK